MTEPEALFDTAFMPTDVALPKGLMVYHYTKWDIARRFILNGSRQLLINVLGKMKDPLESNGTFLLGSGPRGMAADSVIRIKDLIDEAYRAEVRIFSTCLDSPPDFHPLSRPGRIMITRSGQRGFDHPSMWAHYGENHAGVCLIFDRLRLDQAIRSATGGLHVLNGEVEYHLDIGRQRIGNKLAVTADQLHHHDGQIKTWARQHLIERQRALIFSKHEDWKHESEYRWAVLGDYQGDLFAPLQSGVLKGVVAGSDFPLAAHEELNELGNELSIPCRIMMWRDGAAGCLWPLHSDDDPEHYQTFWKRHEIEAARRRG